MTKGKGEAMDRGKLETQKDQKAFILAGNATFTVQNEETGNRFTFKVRKAKARDGQDPESAPWFVKVLTSPDNESGYTYLGTIFGENYSHGRKSKLSKDCQSEKAFSWFWGKLNNGGVPDQVSVWHEGSCGRCGRKLTVPESIKRGLGPDCAGMVR